jgi:hypothetical protein
MLRITPLVIQVLCIFTAFAQQATQQGDTPTTRHGVKTPNLLQADRDFEQFAPYWTCEPGWNTDLQLRNNLVSGSLTVRPSLRVADGSETALAPVTLQPGEVQSISIIDALMKVGSPLAGGSNAYGSIVLRYTSRSMKNLYGSVMVHDTGHPIMYHLDAINQAKRLQRGSREGIWWLPTAGVHDYLVVTNQASHPVHGELYITDASNQHSSIAIDLGGGQTQRLSVRDLVEKAGFSTHYGASSLS